MRSLYTAASGMEAQQQSIDTISNNIANVNTVGYKSERTEFETLMYQTMERADMDPANQTGKPVNLQSGSGVKPVGTARIFTQGSVQVTDYPLDFCIEGDGFFVVDTGGGNLGYTRNGSFKLSMEPDGGGALVTSQGYYVLDTNGEKIIFPEETVMSDISVSSDGLVSVMDEETGTINEIAQIDIVQFPNTQGIEAIGNNLYVPTVASGQPISEADGTITNTSSIVQGALEASNVSVADEMINLIITQRAYELNSKSVTTADEMMQTANNLKR